MNHASRTEFLTAEFDAIAEALKDQLPKLRGKTLILTGATGFFGKWLTSSLAALSLRGLDLKIIAISRNSRAFLDSFPHLPTQAPVQWIDADLSHRDALSGVLPANQRIDYIIHAATSATLGIYENQPVDAYRTMINGTESILEVARVHQARFLFTSSGAVYGRQPSALTHVPEEYLGAPTSGDYRSMYGECKRMNETLCAAYGKQYGLSYVIARCFAFSGPFLPLTEHFAVADFVADCLAGRTITIQGDGTPYRSYLYGSDLVIGLLSLLLSQRTGEIYNLGSEEDATIEEIARHCAAADSAHPEVKILTPRSGQPPARYVPSMAKMKRDFDFAARVSLKDGIARMLNWHRLAH